MIFIKLAMKEAYNYQSCNENKKENNVMEELIDVLDENGIKIGDSISLYYHQYLKDILKNKKAYRE